MIVITSAIAFLIPDMPRKLRMMVQREAYLTNEIVVKTELDRAKVKYGYETSASAVFTHSEPSADGAEENGKEDFGVHVDDIGIEDNGIEENGVEDNGTEVTHRNVRPDNDESIV